VLFDGLDLVELDEEKLRAQRPRMQMVFQDPLSSLNPGRKIGSSVNAPLRILGVRNGEEVKTRTNQMLEDVGLDPERFAQRYPRQLSGGQCQRVSIARALMSQPDLLICDEPVSALDVSVQAQILNLLDEMKEAFGLTMLFISHDMAVVKKISDRVAVMYLGVICETASSESLYSRPAHPYTAALLAAIPEPDPDKRIDDDYIISGDLPSSTNPPSGCRFRTRCPQSKARCSALSPPLYEIEEGHKVACHYPLWGDVSKQAVERARINRNGSHNLRVDPTKPRRLKRKLLLSLLAASAIGAAFHFGPTWYHRIRYVETTNNANAQTEMTTVSSKVTGYAEKVEVSENELVEIGQPLVKIEDKEYQLRISQVKAELERVAADREVLVRKSAAVAAGINKAKALVSAAEAEQKRAKAAYQRTEILFAKGSIALQVLETTKASSQKADSSVKASIAELEEIQCDSKVLEAELARLNTLEAGIESSLLLKEKELKDTLVLAPSQGIVSNITVRQGQYVRPGEPLLAVVPMDDVWVIANYKEVQLEKMRVGQAVQIKVDAYPNTLLEGLVESFSPATGSEFSILPPQNATGNFNKIVQRVPVKIRLHNDHPLIGYLRPGMSVVVSIDTSSSPVPGGLVTVP
jgi:peptide/nickel transport system ATP-binding protein